MYRIEKLEDGYEPTKQRNGSSKAPKRKLNTKSTNDSEKNGKNQVFLAQRGFSQRLGESKQSEEAEANTKEM